MINKIPPKSVHFDNTVHVRFGVNTLRLHWYMRFGVSHSTRTVTRGWRQSSCLQACKWHPSQIANRGVWVPQALQHRRLGPVLLECPKWRLTYWQMVSPSRQPVASLDLRYVLVYRCSHVQDGGLTQMSLLSQNTVTFSGYTPKHTVSSPLLLCNEIQTHTLVYILHLTAVINFGSRASLRVEQRRTLTYLCQFLSLSNLRLREEYLHNTSIHISTCTNYGYVTTI